MDEENGLDWYYFGARYYVPAIARWLQVDPLANLAPGWSPYNYTFNNPTDLTDPDGRFPWGAAIGAAVEYGFQLYNGETNGGMPTGKGWAKIGASATAGALSSGLSSLTRVYKAGKIIASTLGNATINVAEGAAKSSIDGQEYSIVDGAVDAVTGGVGGASGQKVKKVLEQTDVVGAAKNASKEAKKLAKNPKNKRRIRKAMEAEKIFDAETKKVYRTGDAQSATTQKAITQTEDEVTE